MPDASCDGCPLRRIPADGLVLHARVRNGQVHGQVAFESVERLATVVSDLHEQGHRVNLRRLRNGAGREAQEISIDLDQLTPRQRTVLRQAHQLGYFEPAGKVTLDDVADALGLGRSTVHEHLQKGLRTVLDECMAP